MVLDDAQIYALARAAGFGPNEAATMTAIALAESGGDASSVVTIDGVARVGLWQIVVEDASTGAVDAALAADANAALAFEVSGRGVDLSAWSSAQPGAETSYLSFRERAMAAAAEHGEEAGVQPLEESGAETDGGDQPSDPSAATDGAGVHPGEGDGDDPNMQIVGLPGDQSQLDPSSAVAGVEDGESAALRTFLQAAYAQKGDTYIFGAVAAADDPDPDEFDCAELVQWAAAQAGVDDMPTGSWLQYLHLKEEGALLDVDEALDTPGALVFYFSEEPLPGAGRPTRAHVAISLGDGENLIEARSTRYGVGQFSAEGRTFTHAAYIPEFGQELDGPISFDPLGPIGPSTDQADAEALLESLGEAPEVPEHYEYGQDTDGDGLLDAIEASIGTDPHHPDTDLDGFLDVEEMTEYATDPTSFADNPTARLLGAPTGPAPETTTSRQARVDAAEAQLEAYEEQKEEAEQAAALAEERAYQEEVRRTAAAEQQAMIEAQETAAAERRIEDRELADQRQQELITALQRDGFSFSDAQEDELRSVHGLQDVEIESLTLAIRDDYLQGWFTTNHVLFDEVSPFSDAEAFGEFETWMFGGELA